MKAKDLLDKIYEIACESWNNDTKINLDRILLPELESEEIEKLIKIAQMLQNEMISKYGDIYGIMFSLYCKILLGEKNTKKITIELDLGNIPIHEVVSRFNPEKVKYELVIFAIMLMVKSFLGENLKNYSKGGIKCHK